MTKSELYDKMIEYSERMDSQDLLKMVFDFFDINKLNEFVEHIEVELGIVSEEEAEFGETIRETKRSPNGTSFHGSTFEASVEEITEIIGRPTYEHNDGTDKTNFEWNREVDCGTPTFPNYAVFTIYDWKEYHPLSENEIVEWHIGGNNGNVTMKALEEIELRLKTIRI